MTGKWGIEPLASAHDRSFDCGCPDLNDYIRRYAGQNDRLDISRTYVAVAPGESVVGGYYAVSAGAVAREALPPKHRKRLPQYPVPSVRLGRLAVDRRRQGQGLGELLLVDALTRVVSASVDIGIRAVIVDAINEAARGFYRHFGFLSLRDEPLHLFLPIDTIRKLCR